MYGSRVPADKFDKNASRHKRRPPSSARRTGSIEATKKDSENDPPVFVNTEDEFGFRSSRRKMLNDEREARKRREAQARTSMAPAPPPPVREQPEPRRTYVGNFERALDIGQPLVVNHQRAQAQIVLPFDDVDKQKKAAQKTFQKEQMAGCSTSSAVPMDQVIQFDVEGDRAYRRMQLWPSNPLETSEEAPRGLPEPSHYNPPHQPIGRSPEVLEMLNQSSGCRILDFFLKLLNDAELREFISTHLEQDVVDGLYLAVTKAQEHKCVT
uniref:PWI domain-containing protein n=1 Tax=Steinernema glaseri TaxID=37863 RepID=A0A1I8AKY1_9BILA